MTELFPVFFATAVLLILSGLEVLFFRLLNPGWWKKKLIRVGSLILPGSGIIFIVIWIFGIYSYNKTLMLIGATLSALDLVLILALLLSLPISGVLNFGNYLMEKLKSKVCPSDEKTLGIMPRRKFLKGAAAVVPAVALAAGFSGVAHAYTDIKVHKIPIYFKDLPPELEGFKILHISDIHIGYYIWLEDVERVLEEASRYEPDIMLATGDLCDRMDVYPDLVELLEQFRAPQGVFASIGNHEYFRGFKTVLGIFERSSVPMLLNNGLTVDHKGAKVHIGGADDPRTMRRISGEFYRKSIERALATKPDDAFSILMSHRPDGFDMAARAGVNLTLAGHTHGAQIGWGGRSVFESMAPAAYLWGHYQKSNSHLYTSAGMGHWFPFRLGCPSEAPVIELRRLVDGR